MGHFFASEQEDLRVLEMPFTASPLKQLLLLSVFCFSFFSFLKDTVIDPRNPSFLDFRNHELVIRC